MKRLSARQWALEEWQEFWYQTPDNIPRWVVYDDDRTKPIFIDGKPTSETRRQADRLFDWKIKKSRFYKTYKEQQKRTFFQELFHAAKVALYYHGCVVYSRDWHRNSEVELQFGGDNDPPSAAGPRRFVFSTDLQIVKCAVAAGLFVEQRSPPGSPKMSRLLPTDQLSRFTEVDPWKFDPNQDTQFVYLRDRKTKNEIEFDKDHPVATEYQRKLTKINEVNAQFDIFYQPISQWDQSYEPRRQLRSVHYARFTDDFDHHGRIYTGHYGHQSLRKVERHTIEFEMEPHVLEPSVELDYGSYHARMAYHLAGIEYRSDPYALWENTTPPMRLMAKTLINAAFNAKDSKAAYDSCNQAMSSWTKVKGRRKQGKALQDAISLSKAADETGLKFKDIYPLAMKMHRKIRDQFSSDAGMRLMRIDSEIALRIMYHFAKQDIPCLGVHDSFIVPLSAKTELRRVMRKFYREKVGFKPVVR